MSDDAPAKMGRPPGWNLGRTRTIRVPIPLAEPLLAIARMLDKKGMPLLTQKLQQLRSIICEESQS